jgi:hypothetical protein
MTRRRYPILVQEGHGYVWSKKFRRWRKLPNQQWQQIRQRLCQKPPEKSQAQNQMRLVSNDGVVIAAAPEKTER